MRLRPLAAMSALAFAAACARTAPPPPTVAPPPVAAPAPVPMPAGARPGMRIPARLPDGRWATPNRGLSAAGTTWHLRAALNVAVLACRGPQELTMVAQYNALLATRKRELAAAETTLEQEYRGTGAKDWQSTFDNQMTRLYNFFAQDFAHDGFCTAAQDALAAVTTVPADGLGAFAAQRLPVLEQPFTDFFTAYDRWRVASMTPAAPTVATPPTPAATVPVAG